MVELPNISLAQVQAELQRRRQNYLFSMFPDTGPLRRELYIKHVEFFAGGALFTERYFRAANRSGKSEAGAYETALHLTGLYPSWWVGRRFKRPINALVAGESARLVRDSIQVKMLGPPSAVGTGMIPFDCIVERRAKSGIPDAVDTVRVKHVSGGESILQFQSFDQGREAFQATARDLVWLDEEPPLSVYSEALTRTMTTQGLMITTFTPLKGMSDTIIFLERKADEGKILRITATWDDAPHLSEADKAKMIEAYPIHQRDARTKGIPALGSGAIYPVPESDIVCAPFDLPPHWRRSYAMDVGWNRTAVVWGAHDETNDVVYLYGEYYRGQAEPSVHAEAIKAHGAWMQGVIDPAARGRGQKDGEQLLTLYLELGLSVVTADNSRETGIYEVYQRLSTGRLKIFSTLQNLLNEYRIYRRDDKGAVVKQDDHLMDCVRYYCMSAIPLGTYPPAMMQQHRNDYGTPSRSQSQHTYDYNPLSRKTIRDMLK